MSDLHTKVQYGFIILPGNPRAGKKEGALPSIQAVFKCGGS